ncbi:hypothetical protein DFP72DRAFT_857075 [Ephemerocybe angulata]|uniref:Uncharacterized protein n=1 Tax=Ephemerocybe angulata TaxID=980116 RepID=A0A8H6LWJ5_9AGAR|nr:hypothetical protein DFP72DRAFT_857075 [Tulosesus angulatus]
MTQLSISIASLPVIYIYCIWRKELEVWIIRALSGAFQSVEISTPWGDRRAWGACDGVSSRGGVPSTIRRACHGPHAPHASGLFLMQREILADIATRDLLYEVADRLEARSGDPYPQFKCRACGATFSGTKEGQILVRDANYLRCIWELRNCYYSIPGM